MIFKLDDRDLTILQALSERGRITNVALAKLANLSATPCLERVKRLEKAGIIKGYQAVIELKELGNFVSFFVTIELKNHTSQSFEQFDRIIDEKTEVNGCWALGGGFDYLLHVISTDIDAYQQFMEELIACDIGIVRYFTYIVTKSVKNTTSFPSHIFSKK